MTIMLSTKSIGSTQRPQVNWAIAFAIANASAQGMTAMKIGYIKIKVKRKNGLNKGANVGGVKKYI